jgi:hypothetical protein
MVVDASVGAYGRWRDECAAVSDAYVSWRSAAPSEAADAYVNYRAALDLEERASEVYADAKTGRA